VDGAKLTDTLGHKVRSAGKAVLAAPADQVATTLAAQLKQLVISPYRIEVAAIADQLGRATEPFAVLICNGGQIIGAGDVRAVVPTESAAVAFDVTRTLDLDGLAAAYGRLAEAKAQVKAAPVPGGEHIEPTLGIIFAVASRVSLEELGEELIRLNARTPSDRWPDLVVVAQNGLIGYYGQLLGSNDEPGILLPPSQDAGSGKRVPVYATMMISATGAETFNLMAHAIFGHLTRWAPGFVVPDQTILDGVPRQAVTLTGYQYDLAGQLRALPRDQYRDRAMPLPSVALFPKGRKDAPPLATMAFLRWQDGGVVLLQGKLPLEGMLVFLSGIISRQEFRKIQKMTWGGLQVSSVLPISAHQYQMLLRNIQQRGGLDVRRNEGKIVVQKFADEGTGSPFMARIFFGQMKLAEALGATDREAFSKSHRVLMTTVMEIRDAAKDVARTWKDYKRRIDEGSIVERQRGQIHVTEQIDRQLGRLTSDFLTAATRSLKDRMQNVALALGLDIGFLFQQQTRFERALAKLQTIDAPLAVYISQARAWSNALVTTRNKLHGDWELPRAIISEMDDGRVAVAEPSIEGIPVTQWVADMTDRILCFIEDVVAHGIQKKMPRGLTLTEVPIARRSLELALRFQNTISGGGLPAWEIRYHLTKFDET
jgi:hypothetical protein